MENKELENKKLSDTINPNDIIIEDDDSDMPEPETKDYDQYIKCTDLFMELFMETVGKLPYASVLKNNNGEQIKLISLVKYVEMNKDKIRVDEMNRIVSWIANLEFRLSRPLMEIIENQERQKELWEMYR